MFTPINIELVLLKDPADLFLLKRYINPFVALKIEKDLYGNTIVIVKSRKRLRTKKVIALNLKYFSEYIWETFQFNKELDDLIKLKILIG